MNEQRESYSIEGGKMLLFNMIGALHIYCIEKRIHYCVCQPVSLTFLAVHPCIRCEMHGKVDGTTQHIQWSPSMAERNAYVGKTPHYSPRFADPDRMMTGGTKEGPFFFICQSRKYIETITNHILQRIKKNSNVSSPTSSCSSSQIGTEALH